jgi:GNAT superfamily N-acetyltransferase
LPYLERLRAFVWRRERKPMTRSPHVDDIPALFALVRALAQYEDLEHEVLGTEEVLREQMFGAHPRIEGLVVEAEGVLVGFALFFHTFSTFLCRPGIYLEDLFVLPEHRRRGYGTALLRAVAKLAVERRCGRFEWTVLDWNEPAKRFYRALGAREMSDWRVMRVVGEDLAEMAHG